MADVWCDRFGSGVQRSMVQVLARGAKVATMLASHDLPRPRDPLLFRLFPILRRPGGGASFCSSSAGLGAGGASLRSSSSSALDASRSSSVGARRLLGVCCAAELGRLLLMISLYFRP
jgi:hypothetical protein